MVTIITPDACKTGPKSSWVEQGIPFDALAPPKAFTTTARHHNTTSALTKAPS